MTIGAQELRKLFILAQSNTGSASDAALLSLFRQSTAVVGQTPLDLVVDGTTTLAATTVSDGAIGEAEIATGAVTATKLGTGAVETAKIAATAVTAAKLNADVTAAVIPIVDAGSFTAQTTQEGATQEIYQHIKSIQAQLHIPLNSLTDADGDPLIKFASEDQPSFGLNLADSEALCLRWNNHATPGTVLGRIAMPQDLDDTAAVVFHFLASKSGATVGDATTLTVTAFFQTVGALHDADANCGGVSSALTGDATAKTVAEQTLSIAHGDVPPAPCSLFFTLTPTAGTLGTDDYLLHDLWIEYKRKVLTS